MNARAAAELVLLERIATLEGAIDPASIAAQVLDEFRGYEATAESANRIAERIAELVDVEIDNALSPETKRIIEGNRAAQRRLEAASARARRPPSLRIEHARIDVTRGPTASHPGDTQRVYTQGMPTYYVDDVEVDEATFIAAQRAARTAPASGSETLGSDRQPSVTFPQVIPPMVTKPQVTDPSETDF